MKEDQENHFVVANGQKVQAATPIYIDAFLEGQGLPPKTVVVEHNGEAVAPSEFSKRELQSGDRLEIVRVVAGG